MASFPKLIPAFTAHVSESPPYQSVGLALSGSARGAQLPNNPPVEHRHKISERGGHV